MLDLLYDYQSNVELYPRWQEYIRVNQPPFASGGIERPVLPARGRPAYLYDVPDAELHLLETGHFATATHSDEIGRSGRRSPGQGPDA